MKISSAMRILEWLLFILVVYTSRLHFCTTPSILYECINESIFPTLRWLLHVDTINAIKTRDYLKTQKSPAFLKWTANIINGVKNEQIHVYIFIWVFIKIYHTYSCNNTKYASLISTKTSWPFLYPLNCAIKSHYSWPHTSH